jgi:hypothetical protein
VEARVCARASLDVVRMENEKTLLSVLMWGKFWKGAGNSVQCEYKVIFTGNKILMHFK